MLTDHKKYIFDLIWSEIDKKYLAFPRFEDEGIYAKNTSFGAIDLCAACAIQLPELKSIVDDMIEKSIKADIAWVKEETKR